MVNLRKLPLLPALAFVLGLAAFIFYTQPFRRSPKIDLSRPGVVKEIQSLNRLETSSYGIEKIVEAGEKGNEFEELLYGDRILLIAHGKVTAGIDMAAVTEKDITVRGTSLSVTLPAPFIFASTLDNSMTRVYDRRQGLLSRGNKDLETEARAAAEHSIREAACEAGILEEARKNAEERVRQLFLFSGFTDVAVTVPAGSC